MRPILNSNPTITIATTLLLFISGCLTPKKMDGWIDQREGGFTTRLKTSDYITIKTPDLPKSDVASVSKKGASQFVPAIFYWKSQRTIVSSLNPYIPVAGINATIIQYANTKQLKQKLNGQKIELTLSKVPGAFTFVDKYQLYFFVLYYIQTDHIFITPQKQDLVISYRILKDNVETKNGSITIADPSRPKSEKFLQSMKKMTWSYLDEYDDTIKAMSKQFVDKLLLEI